MRTGVVICIATMLLGITSCSDTHEEGATKENSQDKILIKDESVKTEMHASKQQIMSALDSSETHLQSIIDELESNPQDLTEIRARFEVVSHSIETKVSQSLDDLNRLGKEGKITNAQADKWLNDIQTGPLMKKHKRIVFLLDSLGNTP